MTQLSRLVRKAKYTFKIYGYLTGLRNQLEAEFIQGKEIKGSVLNKTKKTALEACETETMTTILKAYENLFKYYDDVYMITVEDIP